MSKMASGMSVTNFEVCGAHTCTSAHDEDTPEAMNPKQTPETQAARARTSFTSRFGCAPDVVTLAPGRVNLIGDHVDYAGGLVMPIAIERTTAVAIGRSKIGHDSTFVSIDLDRTTNVTLRETLKRLDSSSENAFANYILGPLAILGQKQLELPEVNLVVASDVPMGGGLSSSAALEVAVLLAMRELLGERTDSLTLALEAQRAEHDFAGGNHPSTLLLCSRCDAFACGQLIALAEHRAMISARLWDIENPFAFAPSHGSIQRSKQEEIMRDKLESVYQRLDLVGNLGDDDEDADNDDGPKLSLAVKTLLGHYASSSFDKKKASRR